MLFVEVLHIKCVIFDNNDSNGAVDNGNDVQKDDDICWRLQNISYLKLINLTKNLL